MLIPLGCAPPATNATIIHLTGTIVGQQAVATASSVLVSGPVVAHITCNQHTTTSNADGTFKLDIPMSKDSTYTCIVNASPSYQSVTRTLALAKGGTYRLYFTADALGTSCAVKGNEYDCPLLQLMPGKIVATMTYHDSKHIVTNGHFRCTTQYATSTNTLWNWFYGDYDAQGTYIVLSLPPGTYTCIAYDPDFVVMPSIIVRPAATTATQVAICESHCPRLRYHDGVVMHAVTAYMIYWLPAGKTFDPSQGAARFEQKTAQFITDVSGTPYGNVLTQYGDFSGPIQNHITLGGTYVDTHPYPHAGTRADPLTGPDIQNEVAHAQQANSNWVQTPESIFVVFTSYNTEECDSGSCSFNRTTGFCGYHGTDGALYALILATSYCADFGATPNGGNIDAAIDVLAHEIAETATDPAPNSGWNNDALNSTPKGGEIGDLCEDDYFSTLADGGDITLHGHDYFIQPLWSNRVNACVFSG